MSDSQNLIETPDLSGAPNLKQLILRRCRRLYKIHASLGDLNRLILLDMSKCECLESFPHNISLNALETFILSGCSRLKSLPSSIFLLKNLKVLSLSESFNGLTSFPLIQPKRSPNPMGILEHSLTGLCSLTILNLSYCKLQSIPNDIGSLSSLECLDLRGNNFVC